MPTFLLRGVLILGGWAAIALGCLFILWAIAVSLWPQLVTWPFPGPTQGLPRAPLIEAGAAGLMAGVAGVGLLAIERIIALLERIAERR